MYSVSCKAIMGTENIVAGSKGKNTVYCRSGSSCKIKNGMPGNRETGGGGEKGRIPIGKN